MVYASIALLAVSAALVAEARTTRFRAVDMTTGGRVAATQRPVLTAQYLDVTLASGKTFSGEFNRKAVLRSGQQPTGPNSGEVVTRTLASDDGEVLSCSFRYVRPAGWFRFGGRGDCASDQGTKVTLAW